jgi:hypothetical protein
MAYSKAALKSSGIKAVPVLDHFGYENYHTDVYLYGLYCVVHLNTF